MDILIILILPIHEHRISFLLCFLQFHSLILFSFQYTDLIPLWLNSSLGILFFLMSLSIGYPFFFFWKILFIFRERGREGEKQQCEIERLIGCLLHTPWPGTEPATQACAMTGNWTSDLYLCGKMPDQLSHTSQDVNGIFSISLFDSLLLVQRNTTKYQWYISQIQNKHFKNLYGTINDPE